MSRCVRGRSNHCGAAFAMRSLYPTPHYPAPPGPLRCPARIPVASHARAWHSPRPMARPKKQDTDASSSNGAPAHAAPNAAADAFTKVEPELVALAAEALAPITIDLGAAVSSVLAAAPRIREHRDAIAEQLPHHPIGAVDKLETYAQAAWYAHLVHTYASGSPESAKALIEEGTKLREGLLIAAEALAHRAL